jgi:pantoate--beta-alanine ligase
MHVVSTIKELNLLLQQLKNNSESVGFVPTMGALHLGHLSLITKAKSICSVVVCSIFVNPTQFNNSDDLAKYPKTLEKDIQLLHSVGCDILFCPEVTEMYPSKQLLRFDFGTLENVLEGAFRPGHFNGVGIIVSKLFHIVQPHHAFFGQKDLQQYLIINKLVNDLSFQVTLHCCEIVREDDGLAMSSRNMRLTAAQREIAPLIYKSLQFAAHLIQQQADLETVYMKINTLYSESPIKIDYFKCVDPVTLNEISVISKGDRIAICIACYIEEVRLIDNIIFNA